MSKKTIVIYHSADFDGIFCYRIARKFLGEKAEYIGWDYNDPVPDLYFNRAPSDIELYMLDISVPTLMEHPGLIWIDHHKSAIEKFDSTIAGFRIDGVAACRLAWQFFASAEEARYLGWPPKQDFIDRNVCEPESVRLAGEYDIWDRRDPDAELFQHGLRSQDLTEQDWANLLSFEELGLVDKLLNQGKALHYAKTKENESIIKRDGFTVHWEGLTFLACNHARFNSHLFTAGLTQDHDACLGFNFDGKGWRVSLYHAPGNEHIDLSLIAVKHGGGGHRGASGFRVFGKPPFLP